MKFSIRDLMLVTVIVALAAGWWGERRRAKWLADQYDAADAAGDVILRHLEKLEEETRTFGFKQG